MTITPSLRFAARLVSAALACLSFALTSASAQSSGTATLTGRVQNRAAGAVLENARVTVSGTNREAFTDAFGEYRLTALPAGDVTVLVFFTGAAPQTATLKLAAGETARKDFELVPFSAGKPAAGDGVVKLDQFVVDGGRDTNAASIAINEQRFAGNIKTVLHTDAMGDIIQNNLGEFVKYLPGVDLETDQMNAVGIKLRGLPSAYTNIAVDGDDVNAASSAGPTRFTLLQTFSLSNAARIDVTKVPTPDSSAASLGGSINMVSRTAFESRRPEFRFKVYVNKNSRDPSFKRQYGGADGDDQKKVFHYQPDFDFSYTVPVSKTFGFSINAVKNDQFGSARRVNRTFSTNVAATNPFRATVDNPYLTSASYNTFPVYEHRYAVGGKVDWKFAPVDTVSFTYSGNWLVQDYEQHNFTINTGANPVSWGTNFTHGATGAGSATAINTTRYVRSRNNIFRLSYRHVGALWDVTSALGYNFADQTYRVISHRQFETTGARLQTVTVDLDGFDTYLPGKISIRNAAGDALDPFNLNNYRFFLNGSSGTRDNDSTAKSAKIDLTRKFFGSRLNALLKFGASTAESYRARRNSQFNPTYVGQDRIANNADDSYAQTPFSLLNTGFLTFAMPRGLPTVQFGSSRRAWELYEQRPQLFDYTDANRRADIRAAITSPDHMTERIDAGYVMGDVKLLENRLRLVLGARYERTTDDGRAVLQDNNARYRQDSAGNLILDANKRPIPLYPNAATVFADGVAEDALVYTKLGGSLRKEYGDYYPSLNATYNITENFLGRVGVARTLGRPDFGNILGITNVTQIDFDPASSLTGNALGTIVTRNPALKPWTANSLDLRLEYYTPNGGEISAGFFRKQIKNFFSNRSFLATPEFLATLGLGDEYVDYQVNAPGNVDGMAHLNGWEFNVSQPLSFFTRADFARYFRVFANSTMVRQKGPQEADFRSFTPLNINWGFAYNKNPLVFNGRWTLVGKKRTGTIGAGNIGANGWAYQTERLRFDASVDYRLTKTYALYATGRNIFNNRDQNEAYAIGSPRYVKFVAEGEYGVNFQFGIKGNF